MSTVITSAVRKIPMLQRLGVNIPQPLILIIITLFIGLASGVPSVVLIKVFNTGFGQGLGSFALILIPSFIIAACLSRQPLEGSSGVMALVAPVTSAGMVCPDTAYATLSSAAGRHKLSVAFSSFAGFRLLYPAGPLIVATGLGVASNYLLLTGFLLFLPVWIAGEIWARYRLPSIQIDSLENKQSSVFSWSLVRALLPLIVLGLLLVVGGTINLSAFPLFDFVSRPKGALLVSAVFALVQTKPESRRECMDWALRRSSWLLLVIGAAGALGSMVMHLFPLAQILPANISDGSVMLVLFGVAMLLKLIHGSSLATFAVATPLLAPIVHAAAIHPAAAVFAICLGTIAILPTDSFYWLVRTDALVAHSESSAIVTLGGGALLQSVIGFLTLYLLNSFGFV